MIDQPIVWIDLETTGLHVQEDCILEIACVITSGDLSTTIDGPNLVVKRDKETLDKMSFWCKNQHKKSGLIDEVLSDKSLSIKEVEVQMLDFVKQHVNPETAPLGGSSVHFDKEFLRKEMPDFYNYLHYRIVDVSSIGEVVRRWHPTVLRRRPKKMGNHRASGDIKDSIRELLFYKENVFRERS